MSQGRPGDHPITDILFHGATYFTPEVCALFKEVYVLSSKHFKTFDGIDLMQDSEETIRTKLLALKAKYSE